MVAGVTKNYRGVRCVRCREPIAVCATVVSLQEKAEYGQSNEPHTFTARCRVCEHENIYSMSDIQVFVGEPRQNLRSRAASA